MALKALLVGINAYPDAPLRGCHNDVLQLRALLAERYSLADGGLRLLLDEAATTAAITDGLRWLAAAEPEERDPVRLFHFAGHGTYIADQEGDEPDGQDECLVPYDYATAGPLSDDRLAELYHDFGPATHLLLVMDSCHSGTIDRLPAQDIRFRFMRASADEQERIAVAARRVRQQRDIFVAAYIQEQGGAALAPEEYRDAARAAQAAFERAQFGLEERDDELVLLAACRADETAADARFGADYHGALSYYLLEALRETGPTLTYGALIERLGRSLHASDFVQEPQLTCSAANRGRIVLGARR